MKLKATLSRRELLQMGLAELVGTALFIYTGLGTAMGALTDATDGSPIKSNTTTIALAFGLSVAWVVHSVSHIKGGCVRKQTTARFASMCMYSLLLLLLLLLVLLVLLLLLLRGDLHRSIT